MSAKTREGPSLRPHEFQHPLTPRLATIEKPSGDCRQTFGLAAYTSDERMIFLRRRLRKALARGLGRSLSNPLEAEIHDRAMCQINWMSSGLPLPVPYRVPYAAASGRECQSSQPALKLKLRTVRADPWNQRAHPTLWRIDPGAWAGSDWNRMLFRLEDTLPTSA